MKKTFRETINTVFNQLINQGGCSIKDTTCLYRGPDNRKCAAGSLIPDSEYSSSMEYTLASYGKVKDVLKNNGYYIDLVRSLQRIHDSIAVSAHTDCEKVQYFKEIKKALLKSLDDKKSVTKRAYELIKEYK